MSLFSELKRRNVFRVGIAYVVAAWVVLQVADLVFEAIRAPGWVLQALLTLVVLGFFAALIIAWAYELTPEGVRRESDVDRSESITHETAHRLNRITIGLLIVVVALVAVERFALPQRTPQARGPEHAPSPPAEPVSEIADEESSPRPAADENAPEPAGTSVAVLPFVNMSSDPENEYFSDGISEEILNVLASIPELKVAARTSAFAFKGSSATIADIARELGVNHVLEGSVRKAGDQVRITAQLIKADDGFHLWSDTYDRELDNVFAIQDEIAASIAGALKVSLGLGKKSSGNLTGTGSIEAYEHYLRGMSLWHERTVSSLRESIAEFEAATELDPQFAKAQAGLALAWGVITGYIVMDEKEAYRKALAAAKRALALDPENVEALAIQGLIRRYQLAYDEGIALFERAIELNPSFASAYQWYGGLLGEMGDPEAGLAMYEKAWSLDPRSRIIGYNLALRLDGLGRREEAFAVIEEVLAFAPDFPDGLNQRMLMQLESGQCTAAGATARRLATLLEKTIDSTDLYLDLCRGGAARATALQTMLAWPRPLAFADPAHPTLSYDYDWMVLMIELNEMGAVLEVLQEQPETFASELAYLRTRATGNGVRFQCDPRVRELQSRVGLAPPVKPPVCD